MILRYQFLSTILVHPTTKRKTENIETGFVNRRD